MTTTNTATQSFLCIGHRGASGHAPENTLAAFAKAINMGCPWIELDVYCVNGQLLVIHDDTLERTTNGSGKVMETSVEALTKLDAGNGEKIPTLAEVIDLVDHRAVINIELKGLATALATNQLLDQYCLNGWQADEFFISSFNHPELALSNAAYGRGALFFKTPKDLFERAEKLNAQAINVSSEMVNEAMVTEAHSKGFKIFVYTVNDAEGMANLKAMQVDGVFTNFPDRFPW